METNLPARNLWCGRGCVGSRGAVIGWGRRKYDRERPDGASVRESRAEGSEGRAKLRNDRDKIETVRAARASLPLHAGTGGFVCGHRFADTCWEWRDVMRKCWNQRGSEEPRLTFSITNRTGPMYKQYTIPHTDTEHLWHRERVVYTYCSRWATLTHWLTGLRCLWRCWTRWLLEKKPKEISERKIILWLVRGATAMLEKSFIFCIKPCVVFLLPVLRDLVES